jgi:GDP-4-dehydro-6-deoxy-D-mannose reductase
MRVLITGAEGFVGPHLVDQALGHGAQTHGTVFAAAPIKLSAKRRGAVYHRVDLLDAKAVTRLLRRVQPDWIFHLAGKSSPAQSLKDPESTLRINILANQNILEVSLKLKKKPRVLIAGSADEYAASSSKRAKMRETSPLAPATPYGKSKLCQDLMGLYYFQTHHLPVLRVRPFNHIGPGQSLGFVATDFASQIVSVEMGRRIPVIEVGNLDVHRDFTDVRDIVRGYWMLMQKGRPGEAYNIGSGKPVLIRTLLDTLLALSTADIAVHQTAPRQRQEKQYKIADIRKIRSHIGWEPRITLKQTLTDVLDDWRKRY